MGEVDGVRVVNGVRVGPTPGHLFKPDRPNSVMCVCGVAKVVHTGFRIEETSDSPCRHAYLHRIDDDGNVRCGECSELVEAGGE